MSHSKDRDGLSSSSNAPGSAPSHSSDGLFQVINRTRNTELGNGVEMAKSGAKRSKGLLGRKGLQPGGGMWIVPCEAIHTFFMQFAIDVVYLDKKLRVRKAVHSIDPWRMSVCLSAHSVLELPPGTIAESQTRTGDVLEFVPAKQERSSPPVQNLEAKAERAANS